MITLYELKASNGRYFTLFTEFGNFGDNYAKAVEVRPTLSATKM